MYITLKLLQNVSSKKKLYVIEGKKYVSVTLKLLENISSKKKLCVIEEEIMFQSIKKKDIFCSRFQYFIGDGAIFFNLPPSLSFFCTLLFLLTVSVIFVNRRSWLPPLIPPPQQIGAISLYRSNLYQKVNVYVIGSLYHATSKKPIALGFSRLREKNSTGALQTPNWLGIGSWNMFLHTKSSSF